MFRYISCIKNAGGENEKGGMGEEIRMKIKP